MKKEFEKDKSHKEDNIICDTGLNKSIKSKVQMRDQIKEYLNSEEGSLWQQDYTVFGEHTYRNNNN